MLLYCDVQVFGPAIMKEEDTLADTPQRSRAEFVAIGASLRHTVRQSVSHIVHGKITVGLERDVALPRRWRLRGGVGFGMARLATDVGEDLASACDRCSRCGG
jgi:hypothetical protein